MTQTLGMTKKCFFKVKHLGTFHFAAMAKTVESDVPGLVENVTKAMHLLVHLTPVWAYQEDRCDQSRCDWTTYVLGCVAGRDTVFALYKTHGGLRFHSSKHVIAANIVVDSLLFPLLFVLFGPHTGCAHPNLDILWIFRLLVCYVESRAHRLYREVYNNVQVCIVQLSFRKKNLNVGCVMKKKSNTIWADAEYERIRNAGWPQSIGNQPHFSSFVITAFARFTPPRN